MLLRKLISDVEEENGRLANMKLSLEESCEQVTLFPFDPSYPNSIDDWKFKRGERSQIEYLICVPPSLR